MEKQMAWVHQTRNTTTTKKKGFAMSTLLPCTDKTETFFPEFGEVQEKTKEAKALCATCPMVLACLNQALKDNQQYGIWGGATVQERKRMRNHPSQKIDHLKSLERLGRSIAVAISQTKKPI